jgi:SAM-dependent methyltransferase
VLSHVIAHVENVDRLLTEVNRVLVPGGRLFVLQSNRYGWWKFWGYYLRRNDRVSHWRTIDAWGIRRYLFDADLEIEDMYAPYHFYLHSKLSELFYRIDRSLEHRVPSAIATQWVVRARKRSSGEEASIKPRMLTIPEAVVLAALATGQAVGIKALELATRVIHGGHSVAEHT